MIKSRIFTIREIKVIDKKMKNKKMNQTDSNYLYKFIKPKLNELATLDGKYLLEKMEYNQKISSIENRIKRVVLGDIVGVNAIVIYGSAIKSNYKSYNDIDILVVTKRKMYLNLLEKRKNIKEIKDKLGEYSILADIQIYDKKTLIESYPHSPNLIYELKDSKIIYGKLKLSKKFEIYNANLQIKLDWSKIRDNNPTGEEIYRAIRNAIIVRLILNKIIDNKKLVESLYDELGKNLIERLRTNKASKEECKYALHYLKKLIEKTRGEIKGGLWEKIEL